MHSLLSIGGLFGFHTPELIAILVILLLLSAGSVKLVGGSSRVGSDPRLTAHERRILYVLAAVATVGVGIVVWERIGLRTQKPFVDPAITASHPFTKIRLGMTKEEVASKLGRPKFESEGTWMYDGIGYVGFKDGAVFTLIAR